MSLSSAVLTRHVGFRVSDAVFETVKELAEGEGKQVSVWCREKITEAAKRHDQTTVQHAILAEVIVVEEIMVQLLYAIVTEGKPSADRFRQITSDAHAAKHMEARKLLERLQPKPRPPRPVIPNLSATP
jgi:hypothetical protein